MPPRKGTKRAAPVEEPPMIEEIDITDEDENEARDTMPSPKLKKVPAKGKKGAKGKTTKAKAKTPKAAPAAKKSKRAESSDDEVESDTEFEVEKIVEMKVLKGVQMYEVKWKGFPTSRNTWEPAENLTQCGDLLENFKEKLNKNNVSRARRVSTMNSTKSSTTEARQPSVTRNVKTPATTSRMTRSRSRTPSRNTHVPVVQAKPTSQAKNRQSSVRREAEEGLSEKLKKLQASRSKSEPKKRESGWSSSSSKDKPKPSPTKSNTNSRTSTASKQRSNNATTASLQPTRSSARNRRRVEEVEEEIKGPSFLAKAAKFCGLGAAAVSAGLGALFYTNPQAVDWNYIGEQTRILFENLQGGDVPGTAGTV